MDIKLKKAGYITGISVTLDGIAHQLLSKSYVMIHRLDNFFDYSSLVYFIGKFIIIAIVALTIISMYPKHPILYQSLGIAIIGAVAFGIILTNWLPQQYNPVIHLIHAVLIFPVSHLILKYVKK